MSDNAENPNISAGIYKVPPEILICVFKLVSPRGPQPFGRPYNDLVNLTHSASYLRAVAINAPSLWTHIDITDRASSFELAKACVQRSSPLNLDVSVRLASRVGARLPGILALIQHVSTRTAVFRVNLFLPGSPALDQARTAFRYFKYPVLETMELDFRTKDSRDNPRWRVPDFYLPEDAPNLQSVTMVDLGPAVPFTTISGITRLVLNAPSFTNVNWPPGRLWGILGQAAALESLELRSRSLGRTGSVSFPPPPLQQPRTTIPNLHRLVLRGFEISVLIHILFNLDAPELFDVILELPKFTHSGWNGVHVQHPFLSVSSLELLFSFRTLPAFHDQFPAFLTRLFPEVEELSLPVLGSSSMLRALAQRWESLTNTAQECSCWPGLYHISITTWEEACDRCCWDRVDAIRDFIQARSKLSLPPLEWVTLTLCDSVKKDKTFAQVMPDMRRTLASKKALELRYTKVSSSACERYYATGRFTFGS